MSLPHEQSRASAAASNLVSELCVPGKWKRIGDLRKEARRIRKHLPMSWDWPRIVKDAGALAHMREMEDHYREEFWKDIKR